MSTLGLNARVWVAWWPPSLLEQRFMEQMGDPRLQYATIKDGPLYHEWFQSIGNFWHIATDSQIEGWLHESVLWPVGGEPMDIIDISVKQDFTHSVEEHSER